MSPASPAWTVIGVLLALGAVALLYRRSRPRGGQHGEGAAYRWLAAAAAAWGAAFAVQVAGVGSVTPTAIQLSLTDLLALLGLPPLVMGLIRLAPPDDSGDAFDRLADGALLSLGIFAMAWIAILRPAYASVAVGGGSFAVDLVHPLADLVVLGGTLAVALRAGRAALAPYLAVVAAALRGAAGLPAGGTTGREPASPGRLSPAAPPSTAIGLTAAGIAAIVTLIFAVVTWGHSGPVPLIAGCALTLALASRAGGLLLQTEALTRLATASGKTFHQLADRTSDVVLLCDGAGLVTYASQAVSHYGYVPGQLTGLRLTNLVHPVDRLNGIKAAATAMFGGSATPASLSCRVRAADGTWRHVQVTLCRYAGSSRPDVVLLTARDVSDQVALRRQVTHLTFHDGLTGLPNRAYL